MCHCDVEEFPRGEGLAIKDGAIDKRWCHPFINLLVGVVIIGGGGSKLVRN